MHDFGSITHPLWWFNSKPTASRAKKIDDRGTGALTSPPLWFACHDTEYCAHGHGKPHQGRPNLLCALHEISGVSETQHVRGRRRRHAEPRTNLEPAVAAPANRTLSHETTGVARQSAAALDADLIWAAALVILTIRRSHGRPRNVHGVEPIHVGQIPFRGRSECYETIRPICELVLWTIVLVHIFVFD